MWRVTRGWWLVTRENLRTCRNVFHRLWFWPIAFTFALLLGQPAALGQGQEVRVAAAADLKFAMDDLAAQYQKQTGNKLDVTYGSSGNFFSQLQNGAPFDLFFSADIEYPRKLEAAGLGEPGTLYEYAVGRIVIWAPPDSKLDLAGQGWNALLDPSVQKICDRESRACSLRARGGGGAAKSRHLRASRGETGVRREYCAGGAVRAVGERAGGNRGDVAGGFAGHEGRQALGDSTRRCIPAIEQGAMVVKSAKNKEAARGFLDFVKSDVGRATLAKYGFTFPAAANATR